MNIINRFTLQTLKRNKVRTAVTIIGILLSTAMFTAVTSIIVSMQQYMIDIEIDFSGAWHGKVRGLTQQKDAENLVKIEGITGNSIVQNVGYARLEDSINEDKPYLCIESITSNFTEMSPIKLIEGRMPENSGELVISKHLSDNGNVQYKIGDTLTMQVGRREAGEGIVLGQTDSYTVDEKALTDTVQKTYQVVGVCERPDYENYNAPGYTAFTTGEKQAAYSYDVLFQLKDPTKIDKLVNKFLKTLPQEEADHAVYIAHSDLLRFLGQSPNGNYMSMLWGMGIILIGIIVIASISLIYNAFSISVSERTKQFGLLKSIGATKKQIRKSVIFEAFSLCLIGIPLGIGCGLVGIGITLHFVGKLMTDTGMINSSDAISLELTISWQAILLAAVIALITVLISAMLPARRAIKMPAIEALRESNEIKIRQKNIRSSKLVYKLFGFEGMLANKNFKRNRRKYHMTVASLTLSVILFLTANSFSMYLGISRDYLDKNTVHDITFNASEDELKKNDLSATKLNLKQQKHVDEVAYNVNTDQVLVQVNTDILNSEYLEYLKKHFSFNFDKSGKKILLDTKLFFVDDNIYKKYLEEQHLNVSDYMDSGNLRPLIWDKASGITEDGLVFTLNMLSDKGFSGDVYCFNCVENFKYNGKTYDSAYYNGETVDATDMVFSFNVLNNKKEKEINIPKEAALTKLSLANSKLMRGDLMLGVEDIRWYNSLTMVLPYSAKKILPEGFLGLSSPEFYVQAAQHKQATTEIQDFFKNNQSYSNSIASHVYDSKASEETEAALMNIINIFSYGFITLISLIVVANVFNTISTNVQLRRKEFAMLKSVGMTKKGFDHMMNYECILYGLKGLLFGLPISLVLCWLMYRSVLEAASISFIVPWTGIIIVTVSIFIIVFASMLYSMSRIKRDNPIEALRNDNL